MPQKQTLAILVGGGPAPGINGIIAAAIIEAIDSGLRVIGIPQGYHWLARGDASHAIELRIPDVSRIHFNGGSILGTSRTNPAREEESLERTLRALDYRGRRPDGLRRKRKMRGYDRPQTTMLTVVNPEQRVPANHPIRLIKELAEVALKELSPFELRALVFWPAEKGA